MFVGSSTGTLLVKKDEAIEEVIRISPRIVSIHSEDDDLLQKKKILIEKGNVKTHSIWRDSEVALTSTKKVVSFANKHKKRIHILHVSSKEEIDFLSTNKKYVTVETTPQFLTLFAPDCYEELGTLAQMNPPIRTKDHQSCFMEAFIRWNYRCSWIRSCSAYIKRKAKNLSRKSIWFDRCSDYASYYVRSCK